jgi:N-acyl-phosphatidylethanolamine-hydrolysing phospholipase D
MHFATFAGSDVEAMEPLLELVESREKEEVGDWTEEGGFGTINVGETATIELL